MYYNKVARKMGIQSMNFMNLNIFFYINIYFTSKIFDYEIKINPYTKALFKCIILCETAIRKMPG